MSLRRPGPPAPRPVLVRAVLGGVVAVVLLAAVAGGLLRAGAMPQQALGSATLAHAAAAHAALMLSAFLGTVIGIERAVAVKLGWAWGAPLASGLAGLAWLGGEPLAGAWLGVVAAGVFVAVNRVVVVRQPAAHTALLMVGALAWLGGNLWFAVSGSHDAPLAGWFAFPVLTIAAERLEMTRLTRRHPLAQPVLLAIVTVLLLGAALSPADPSAGGVAFGLALVALAVWLGLFDIARRTVTAHGLSRYMAVCLLLGYFWLLVAGWAWADTAWGGNRRDMALHALGLGFVISMVMGHAPVILPAVARVKLLFGPWFYVPLALLHGSLALRLSGGESHPAWRAVGAGMNAIALVAFALTVAASAWAWRVHNRPST